MVNRAPMTSYEDVPTSTDSYCDIEVSNHVTGGLKLISILPDWCEEVDWWNEAPGTQTHTYANTCTGTHTHTHTHLYVYIYIYIYTHTHAYSLVYRRKQVCTHAHTYTNTHRSI